MINRYRLHIQLNDDKETFVWDERLYSVCPGTKSFIVEVSEGSLVERLRDLLNDNQYTLLSTNKL